MFCRGSFFICLISYLHSFPFLLTVAINRLNNTYANNIIASLSGVFMNESGHISVLLNECIDALNIKPDGIYVDGTLGMGGHSEQILKQQRDT